MLGYGCLIGSALELVTGPSFGPYSLIDEPSHVDLSPDETEVWNSSAY